MRDLPRSQRFLAMALVASVMLLANSGPLYAGTQSGNGAAMGTFTLKIDQNLIGLDNVANICNIEAAMADGATGLEGSLLAAEYNNTGLASMWLPYTSILNMRETPGILLSNSIDSQLNIIGMELSLQNNPNNFMAFEGGEYFEESYASGEYTYMDLNTYDYYRVDPDLVPANVEVFDNETRFTMSFGNGGMKPGRASTFLVKTSTGINLQEFFNESTLIDVAFQDPNTDEIYTTGPLNLNDIDEFNDNLVGQFAGGTKNGLHFSEMVDPYWLGGTTVVPEPASLLIVASGLCCLALRRRRVTHVF